MLDDLNKTSTLWKHYKGWGSTHTKRETFEELYRSFERISTNSVLTYGDLIPKTDQDELWNEVKALDESNKVAYYKESSFRTIPIVEICIDVPLTSISSNCNHAFVIQQNGQQVKNIIPYDYSDSGLYNYVLKTVEGKEIPWGVCDWVVDTNSSLLTFSNGVPEGVDAQHPPVLTFYKYVGPVGERHYIDATLFDIQDVPFEINNPVADCTEQVSTYLENIEKGFFQKYGFKGDDLNQGIGLQFNIISNIIETSTGDPLKGYDDNSNSQVVQLASHLQGAASNINVMFVSEGIVPDTYSIQVETPGISKIDLDDGFMVVQAQPGNFEIKVTEGEKVKTVLLVKDNKTLDYELFFPREDLTLTTKIPVFVDLMKLPPHLKLTSLSSYSDHITPQYYGPRTVDFVIAADQTSVNYRSADYVVYNKEGSYLLNVFEAMEGNHILLRNGVYENGGNTLTLPKDLYFQGESKKGVIVKNANIILTESNCIQNITFIDCTLTIKDDSLIKNCSFSNTLIDNGEKVATLIECNLEEVEVKGNAQVFDSTIINLTVSGNIGLHNSSVVENCEVTGTVELHESFVNNYHQTEGVCYTHSSRIKIFDAPTINIHSVIDTTSIELVENIPEYVKIDSSYVTKFSEKIRRPVYPNKNTIPFYTSFEKRVYAELPDPFIYNEETNQINIKLDTIEHTLFINEKGEIQCRFFSSKEIWLQNPDNLKTQIEDVYGEHADTPLSINKPDNVEDALIDLYWSKADLKNGKVPIDQLPDSVAYGGLTLVGMWSFEDSEGEYPTFKDVDTQFSSDDEYTGLQNGWFFIVEASHKEDDPVAPQYSKDGVEWTAGDWIIYTGRPGKQIDFSKKAIFKYNDTLLESVEFGENKTTFNLLKNEDSYEDSFEDSYESSFEDEEYTTGKITVDYTGKVIKTEGKTGPFIEGIYLKNIKGLKPLSVSYKDSSEGTWHKLDRAYLDPVYSRLPELATKTGEENPQWSIDDGGTGLLRLSYLSLAEAIRLINETLLKLSPSRPTLIKLVDIVLDEEKTTATKKKYIEISNGQLPQYVEKPEEETWESKESRIYFKQKGQHDQLPLEHCFYCGTSSEIEIKDGEENISCEIERFDPYEKYRLGFKAPTVMTGAEVSGFIELNKTRNVVKNHEVVVSQENVKCVSQITEDPKIFDGDAGHFTFTERKFYDFNEVKINRCDSKTVNITNLNRLMSSHRTGGFGYLPTPVQVSGGFIIENFAKYGSISKDTYVTVEAFFNEKPLEVEITNQLLEMTNKETQTYDLTVSFNATLATELPWELGELKVKAQAHSWGKDTLQQVVLDMKDLLLIKEELMTPIVESGEGIYPTLGEDVKKNFGKEYSIKDAAAKFPEVVWGNNKGNSGYGWPELNSYLNSFTNIDTPVYQNTRMVDGTKVGEELYRFVTFKKSFDSIYDLCGFYINIDWAGTEDLILLNPNTGLYENILLQVNVHSLELDNKILTDGNAAVPVFFTASLEEGENCCHPGKSNKSKRRITFGRKPLPIKDIYIRIGIPKGVFVKDVSIEIEEE